MSVSTDVRNTWAWLALRRWPCSSCMENVFLLPEVMLNSGFQNIWRTNYAITFTASDSSSYNCSWFGVPAAVLSLQGYYAISSDHVTIRHGIIPQKTCFFNKLPFICFVVSVISPINVVCEQFSQYCILILIITQQDAAQNGLFIILQLHSTCFGCQPYPSSGVHKTVTTASGTVQLPPSNVPKLGHVGER